MRGTRPFVPSSPLALAIGSVLGIALPGAAWGGQSTITTPGDAGRSLGTLIDNPDGGSVYDVRSGRTRGNVDFNSFGRFEVANGDTVNLHLSNNASTVVNLVWDARALIDGTLNSLKDGAVGGRVVFADSHGLVVGASGVLNVGSLVVATPTTGFMERLVSSDGATVDAATAALLRGTIPLSDGSVEIQGRINARDDVRIQARAVDVTGTVWVAGGTGADALHSEVAVNTGAGDGVRLVNDGGNILLVAKDQLALSGTLHADGGDVVLQADDTVRIGTGAVVNTRDVANADDPLAASASIGDSGAITVAGRDIGIASGALLDAHATGAHAAGDITVAAADRAQVQTGLARAASRAFVDGTLRGGDITVSATTVADSSWTDPDAELATVAGNALVEIGHLAGTAIGGAIGYLAVDTSAEVAIGANAHLRASGDVDLHASTSQTIETVVTGLRGDLQPQNTLSVGALYADLDTTSTARVARGARIDAGGMLDVSATTDNSLDVAVTSYASDGTAVAVTLAVSTIDVESDATIDAGTRLGVGGLRVGAHNQSGFSTSAVARSDDTGAVGLAAAISLQDVTANARVGADVDTRGDVVIEAASLVSGNATDAMVAEPLSVATSVQRRLDGNADGGDAVAGVMGKGFTKLKGALGEQGQDATDDTPVPFRLGAAMTYTDGAHTAQATLGDGARVRADGDVAIHADVVDAGIAITAGSAIDAQGKDEENPGSSFSLSAGVAITNLRHGAVAEIGRGAEVEAEHIGVGAEVTLPMDFSALQGAIPDFSSFGAFMTSITNAKNLVKKPWELFTSYASASSSADDLALGGVVNHYRVINDTRAWVGEGAKLTSTAAAGSAGWDTTLAGTDRKANWDQSIAVTATTDSQSLHAAGDMELELSRVGAGKDGAAVGGSFNNIVYDTTTIAGIARDVVVTTDAGVAVDATTRDNVVSLALMAGSGSSIGIDGTMALLDVSSTTRASVSRDARVTAASLDVDALQDLFVWSVSGALAMSNSLSIGLGVGVHNLATDTRAYVGDNAADAPGAPAGTTPVENTAGTGAIRVDALSVQAQSKGLAGAVAVAGAVAKSDNAPDPDAKPGFVDKLKKSAQGKVDGLRAGAADKAAQLPVLSSLADKIRGEQGAGASDDKPAEPEFGISISGSASVNLIAQKTRAYLDGADTAGRAGKTTRVDVAAVNDTTLTSASGSAAITLAKADSSKFSAAIGGAVSYSVVDNDTEAYLSRATLTGAREVAVHALSGGEQTNVALGVSVNKSTNQSSAFSVAGSFSIGRSSNDTRAWLSGSTLSGGAGDDRLLDVAAYGRTHIGIGAGSLYFGGRGGVGAALTYAEIADTTEAAIDGGSVSNYDDVSLRALDAARIVAGAAMAGGGGDSNGLSGAVVYNKVDNTTRARIGGGATLEVDRDLLVQGRSTVPVAAFENRLGAIGSNPDSDIDYRGTAIGVDVDGGDVNLGNAGNSILAVAGLIQAGKNNIGLSFVGNEVDNVHTVEIADAQLDVGRRARLDAADSTAILGLSIGVGVATGKFAGMGNATANLVGNRTQVLIGDAGAATDTTRIDAGTLQATASDATWIGSLAGNVAIGAKAALGAAVTYNAVDNTTSVDVRHTQIDSTGAATFAANNDATIVAGAIAGAVGGNAAVSGSFAWSDIGNTTRASLADSRVVAQRLGVTADSTSDISTLSGAVSGSGTAAVGAAINIATIDDETEATLDGVRVAVIDDIEVAASGSGIARSLAVAGAASGNVAVGGSSSNAVVDNTIAARVSGLRGLTTGSGAGADRLTVSAENTGEAHSLAGAVSAGSNVAVGGAVSVNLVGGETSASIGDSVLAIRDQVAIEATSRALVNTVAGTGSASSVGISGAATTNVITGSTRATLADTALNSTATDTVVSAVDSSQINSIAGSLGFGGNVGVGAAVAVNVVSNDVTAQMLGGGHDRLYHGRNVRVGADANGDGANINTIAAGIGGGGSVGGAASVAVNVVDGSVTAEIAEGANVVAERNVGVIAGNTQGINVFAGSLGIGGSAAGIGLGTVVNVMDGTTQALVHGTGTRVSALAKDGSDRLRVDAGDLADPRAIAVSSVQALEDYLAPDLRGNSFDVSGLAVNASTRQHVATLGVSGAVSFNPVAGVSLAAMAGVNVVGGQTRALIEDARINQHAGLSAGSGQQVDVRASSHSFGANFIAGVAAGAGGSASGALATNVFDGATEAGIEDSVVDARGTVSVDATSSQNSLIVAAGLAGGLAGGAGTGVVNVFKSSTDAFVRGGTLDAAALTVDADNRNAASLVGGAVAVGAVAASGTLLVNVSETSTRAGIEGAGITTDGDVDVRAHSDTEFQGIAVSGSVSAGGAALAGMAQINVIGNTTEAAIVDADIAAGGDLSVEAVEALALRAYSGALALNAGSGVGFGAGANVSVLGSKVRAAVVDSSLDIDGGLTVTARADRDVEMVAMTAGVGGTAGIGGGAGLLLSGVGAIGDSDSELGTTFARLGDLGEGEKVDGDVVGGRLDESRMKRMNSASRHDLTGAMGGREDQVIAAISGSTVDARDVSVSAENALSTRNLAGGLGVGGLGAGGAFAFTGLYGETRAGIETTTLDTRGDIAVEARNRDGAGGASARVEAYAGGAGGVGIGAAVAVARVGQDVSAEAGGTLRGQGGKVKVKAGDSSSIDVDAIGAAAGAAAAGIVVADARRSSGVEAALLAGTQVSGFGSLLVDASGTGAVSAYGLGAAGGILAAGTGVGVTAKDDTAVVASVGDHAQVNVSGGGVDVRASARPDVSAEGLGAAVAGTIALGAVVVEAGSANTVEARVGDDVTLGGRGGLRVSATADHVTGEAGVRARSTAGTGGVFLSANASTAKAGSNSRVVAGTGRDLKLPDGDVSITARNLTSQQAEALGVAVGGLIAAGAVVVEAGSDTVTRATLGDGVSHHAAQGAVGHLTVEAIGVDRNAARGVAGSGGLVAGNAAVTRTRSVADVDATLGDDAGLVVTGDVRVKADHDARYAGQADSTNAAVIGGSGAQVFNYANANVHAGIGERTAVLAGGDIDVRATNRFNTDLASGEIAVRGAAGGVISGSAAGVDTELHGTTKATVGAGAELLSGLDAYRALAGDISVVAATLANTHDNASLSTGGAINVARVSADLRANFDNAVSIGNDAWLSSQGYVNLGTYTRAFHDASALVNTWGLAAVGVADSDVRVNSAQSVDIGEGALVESLSNSYVTAGRDATGLNDSLIIANSVAEGYVRGLIAVPDASASTDVTSNADARIRGGADVFSASNVTAGAYTGETVLNASGIGRGYQLGFIPVTQRDSTSNGRGTGRLTVDGTLLAGRYNELDISIDANGVLTQNKGLAIGAHRDTAFRPREFLDALCNGGSDSDGCKALTALRGSVAEGPVNAWTLGPMFAAGGDVFLHGTTIGGSGAITAQGAPSIRVVNNSDHYLLLDEITLPDYDGGRVRFTGVAGSAPTLAVTETPSTTRPSVFIHNAWQQTDGPAIFAMEGIRNIGGLVHLRNEQGSLGQFGTVYAQQQIVEAPNGIVTFANQYATWFSGSNPQSDWRHMLQRPSDPDDAAAYIANYLYGNSVGLDGRLLHRSAPDSNHAGSSIVLYGACLPHSNSRCTNGPYGGVGFYQTTMPTVPLRSLSRVINTYGENSTVQANADSGAFRGQQIYVRARYIDVNSTIDAGAGTNWSLRVLDNVGLAMWLAARDAIGHGLHEIPSAYLATIGGDSRLIKASYDAANGRIVVDNVNASGGGYVYLDGRIVSTTPHGKVKVSSGFGEVRIDSTVDRAVQLKDINVGNGAVGVVEIVDREKGGETTPTVTWYVSRQGQSPVAYDNRLGATSYDDARAVRLDNASVYNPQAGMRYQWGERAYVRRNYTRSEGILTDVGDWYWTNSSGQLADSGQQWSTQYGEFYRGTAGGPVFEQRVTGGFWDTQDQTVSYGCGSQTGSCNYGFGLPTSGRANPRGTGWATWWQYQFPTRGYVDLNASVKADNAIAIDFSGAATGLIDVDARGDLLLTGRLLNPGGRTELTTVGTTRGGVGDIVRTTDTAMITTRDLTIDSTGGIGVGGRGPLQVTLTPDGSLVATSGNRGVSIDVHSDAAVRITAGKPGSGYGDVTLTANGDISGLAGSDYHVAGRDISLRSLYGGIGSTTAPLVLRASETVRSDNSIDGGAVSAAALNDIALRDVAGDFWIDSVVSEAGDVHLHAASGALLDASLRTGADVLSDEQIARIRQNLRLDGSGVDDSVSAFERQVEARYQEYWRLRGLGQVRDGVYAPDALAIELFRGLAEAATGEQGLSDAQVGDYIAGRYATLEDYFAGALGGDWAARGEFLQYDAAFTYAVTTGSQQYDDLSRNASWTDAQLRYAINASALEPSGGGVGAADPTVSARNVTLRAATAIGRLATDLDIEYVDLQLGNLDSEQALALALANTPGDVLMIGANGEAMTREQLLALTAADIANGAIASIRIKRTSPLFVEVTGQFDGQAGHNAYLQARGDLRVGQFLAGGDARLAASGSILDAASGDGAAITVGGDLVLTAGNGNIGGADGDVTAAQALAVNIAGRLLSATAGQNVLIRQTAGDLRFGTVFANGLAALAADAGGLHGTLDGISIDARSIQLTARDDIGRRGAGTTSGLDGALQLRVAASGQLDGNAGGRAWVSSPDRVLNIGELRSGADLDVAVGGGALHAGALVSSAGSIQASSEGDMVLGHVHADGQARLTATRDLSVDDLVAGRAELLAGRDITLDQAAVTATLGISALGDVRLVDAAAVAAADVRIEAGALAMGAGSGIAARDTIDIDVDGDMQLGQLVVSGNGANARIDLQAGGRIDGNGDAVVHLAGGDNVAAELAAGAGIGRDGSPLRVSVGRLDGHSAEGDIHLHLPDGGLISSMTAAEGDLSIDADDALEFGLLAAQRALRLVGTDAQGATLRAGLDGLDVDVAGTLEAGLIDVAGDAIVRSGVDTTVDSVDVAGGLSAQAGRTLRFDIASVGKDAALGSGHDTTLGTLGVGGKLTADAGRDLTIGIADIGADADLRSGAAMQIGTALFGGNVDATAGSVFEASQLQVAGNATIDAADIAIASADVTGRASLASLASTTLGRFAVAGSLDASAGTDLVATELLVGEDAVLVTGRDTTIATIDVGGTLIADAGNDLVVDIADIGADADLRSGAATRLRTALFGGNVDATAGSVFEASQLQVAGNATIDATDIAIASADVAGHAALASLASTTLGRFAVGSLDAAAGMDLVATELRVGEDAVLVTGRDTTIATIDVGGTLIADAGNDLAIDIADIGVDADLRSGAATRLGTALVDGNVDASAGTLFEATRLTVGGKASIGAADIAIVSGEVAGHASLASLASTTLGRLVVGSLDAVAGTDLDATDVLVGEDAVLVSGHDTTIDTLAVGGALIADAGRDLRLNAVDVGTDATLDSGGDTRIDTLDVGGTLIADAGNDLTIDLAGIGADAHLLSGAATQLGTALVGGNVDASAGTLFEATRLDIGGNASIGAADVAIVSGDVAGRASLASLASTTLGRFAVVGSLDATAGTDLVATELLVGKDAVLVTGRDTTIDTLAVGGALTADAGNDLAIGIADIGADANLRSGAATQLGTALVGGNVDASAGTLFEATRLKAGGNTSIAAADIAIISGEVAGRASLASLASTTLGRFTVGGLLDATAGTDLVATELLVGKDAVLLSGRDTTIDTLEVGDSLIADAGNDLTIDIADIGANASLRSAAATRLGTASVGGNVDAAAGSIFEANQMRIAGKATIDAMDIGIVSGEFADRASLASLASTTLGRFVVGGSLDATAGTGLVATELLVGEDAVLVSGHDTTIDTLEVGGSLVADAGHDLQLDAAEVGTDAALGSGQDTRIATLAVGGALTADAGNDLVIEIAGTGADASLRSGAATRLGTASVGGNMDATAGSIFEAGQLRIAGNATIDATDIAIASGDIAGRASLASLASTTLERFAVSGSLDAAAGTDLVATELRVGEDAVLVTDRDTTIDTLDVGGALTADAGNDLTIGIADIGADANLRSGAATRLGTALVGGNVDVSAGTLFEATQLAIGGDATIDATDITVASGEVAGHASLVSLASTALGRFVVDGSLDAAAGTDLVATEFRIGEDAVLVTGRDTTIDTLNIGGALTADAGNDLTIGIADIGADADLRSAAATRLGTARVGGDVDATSGSIFEANQLRIGGNATIDAADIVIASADVAGHASLASLASTALGRFVVDGSLDAAAGTDLVATELRVEKEAVLVTGGDTTIDTLEVGDTLIADAGNDLTIGIADIGSDADLRSGAATRLGTASVGGNVDATAGSIFEAGQLRIGGNATVDVTDIAIASADVAGRASLVSFASTTLGRLAVGSSLDAAVGTDLVATELRVGEDAALVTGGDTTIDTLKVGGSLIADAGQDLQFATVEVGMDAALGSGQDTRIATLAVGGALTADAGNDLTIDTAEIDSDASLRSAAATQLGTASVGGNMDATAGSIFEAGQLRIAGNATIDATDIAIASGDVAGRASLASLASTTLERFAVSGSLDAAAGTDLVATELRVGEDAVLVTDRDTTIDTLDVGGALTADAGNDLAIGIADIGSDADLRSGTATRLGVARIGGTVDATAGSIFEAGQLRIAGNATIDATDIAIASADVAGHASLASLASTALGRLAVGGSLDAAAGTDLVATELRVEEDAVLVSGRDTTIDTFTVGGALIADAGRDLRLDAVEVGMDATLGSGRDTTIDTLRVGGALMADAGHDLAIEIADIGFNARLQSAASTQLGTVAVGGDLDALAETVFNAAQLTIGGNATIDAADIAIASADVAGRASLASLASTALGRLAVAGSLDAAAGADLVATELLVGDDAVLASGRDTTIGVLEIGGTLAVDAGRNLAIDSAVIGADAVLASGRDTTLGTVATSGLLHARAGHDLAMQDGVIGTTATLAAARDMALGDVVSTGRLDVDAGRDLRFARLESGMGIAAVARTGRVLGGNASAGTTIGIDAATDIRFETVIAGTRADLVAGRDVFGGVLHADTTDVRVDAGHDIDLGDVTAARDVLVSAGNGIRLGNVRAGRDIGVESDRELAFGEFEAARDLQLHSRSGGIAGDALRTGRNAALTAAQSVRVGDATVGGDYTIGAGRDIDLGWYHVDGTTALVAGGDIVIDAGTGVGSQRMSAGGGIAFGSIAGEADIEMHASGGAIQGALLEAPDAYLSARDRIGLDLARIGSRLNLASAEIFGNVEYVGGGGEPISMMLTGYHNGVARRIALSVDARDGWIMDRLAAVQAELDTTARTVDIRDGWIRDSMRLTTPTTRTWMHNWDPSLVPADVQLIQPGRAFVLSQQDGHTTTDAYVVRYGEGYQVQAPNHQPSRNWTDVDYYGESVLRFTFRTLEESSWSWQGLARHPFVAWRHEPAFYEEPVESVSGAVNTGISL